MTKWRSFYQNLSKAERAAYADKAGTSVAYIENYLLGAKKVPRRNLMQELAKAAEPECTLKDLLDHFHGDFDARIRR